MVKINFIVLFFIFLSPIVCAQRVVVSDSVVFSGVVFDTQDSQTLPNVTCRYGEGKATISDQMGCFVLKIGRKDTVRFTFVGYKPCTVVMPDTLLEDRYMMGVFLSPDTLQLSEALILRRWGEVQRQNLINARNNMTGILKQAYAPVDYMDADMNQRMMLNEYARSVEMKGHVDVGIGVGTQSVDAYKMLRMRRRVKNQKEWLNPNEIDLLKKIYYLKKQEDRRTELNIKAKAIDQEGTEFQRKLQNNGFISEARAIEARDQLLVKQENFRRLQQEMMDKASREQSELNKQLFDEITNFLKEYNKEKGFSIVLSTQLGGNVLYAEDGFDITKEIVDRLNANYKKGDSQK